MGENTKERIDFVIESGMGVIGTVDDAITQIEWLLADEAWTRSVREPLAAKQ